MRVFSARLPLDEKLFERDLQAALKLSEQSTEDDKDMKAGWMSDEIIPFVLNCITYIIESSHEVFVVYIC